MTNGNPRPDEEPAPPTSTGRSEMPDANDDEIAPPFVPGGSEATSEPTVDDDAAGREEAPDPMAAPFDPASEAGGADDGAFPFETGWDADDAEDDEGGAADEDDFPMDAFDIEGGGASWLEEAGPAGEASGATTADVEDEAPAPWESTPEKTEAAETRGMHAARELAGRLEEMARRLRDQGPEAARAELESPDRFTALLAGLLAGYLAGKE